MEAEATPQFCFQNSGAGWRRRNGSESWVGSANDPGTGFPIQNLPYGVFRAGDETHIGIAIGALILDLHGCATAGMLRGLPDEIAGACIADVLNPLMALGHDAWAALRERVTVILDAKRADAQTKSRVEPLLVPMADVVMQLPATDRRLH